MAHRMLRSRARVVAAATAAVTAAGVGMAVAATTAAPPSNAASKGMGVDEYGMTKAFINGRTVGFTYTKGFFCDTRVSSRATSGCEAGATFKHAPARHYDPLYITVPLFANANPMKEECPSGLVCVDHPGTIDLSRLSSALGAPKSALRNAAVPGHDHFITDTNNDKPEWWDVQVIGVTKKSVYNDIRSHKSYRYIQHLRRAKNPNVTGNIPTNLFLYFGVK